MREVIKAAPSAPFSDKEAVKINSLFKKLYPNGEVTAEEVLKEAEKPESILHRFFEWDDTRAAKQYRLRQARKIISGIVVEIEDIPVRKYVSPVIVKVDTPKKYYEVKRAMANESIWNQVLSRAMNEAKIFRDKYSHLKELTEICSAITKTEKKIGRQLNG